MIKTIFYVEEKEETRSSYFFEIEIIGNIFDNPELLEVSYETKWKINKICTRLCY